MLNAFGHPCSNVSRCFMMVETNLDILKLSFNKRSTQPLVLPTMEHYVCVGQTPDFNIFEYRSIMFKGVEQNAESVWPGLNVRETVEKPYLHAEASSVFKREEKGVRPLAVSLSPLNKQRNECPLVTHLQVLASPGHLHIQANDPLNLNS